jgi:DNA-binding LytR/AlgR family response regulator
MSKSTKLSCLIIEDEPIAAEVLKDYVEQVSFLELKGICKDAIFALERLKNESIDVLFLDIHLPKLKGLEFLKILKDKPQTILTTAYHQYALDAFEEEVVDYLMKPIEFSRFLKAVNKLKPKEVPQFTPNTTETSRPFRFFNVNKKMVKVFYDEVLYVESLKDYSKIFTKENVLTVRGQIGEMEAIFNDFNFLRIHRSFIVPLEKIQAYSATEIEVEGKNFPIGRSYKQLVSERIRAYFQSSD